MRYFLFPLLLLPLAACVGYPSLNPLYESESDTILLDGLDGTWKSRDGESPREDHRESVWEFQKRRSRYELVITEQEEQHTWVSHLEAHVVKIGDRLLLDTYPISSNETRAGVTLYGMHFVPAHQFWQIELGQDRLHLEFLDLTGDRLRLPHTDLRYGRELLTADTTEIITALQHQDSLAFAQSGYIEMERVR